MLPEKVSISTRQIDLHHMAIDIKGELTSFAENDLMEAFARSNVDEIDTVILNFSQMDYINSSGIGLLVTLLVRAKRQGKKFVAYGLNDHVKHIFELTRLNQAILLYNNETEAMGN